MRTLKQRKHKKNNSLKRYKRNNKRNKNKKMIGGAVRNPLQGNINTPDDEDDIIEDNSTQNPLIDKQLEPDTPNDYNQYKIDYDSGTQPKQQSSFWKNMKKNIPKFGNDKPNEIKEYNGNTNDNNDINDINDTLLDKPNNPNKPNKPNKPKGSFFEGISNIGQNMKTFKNKITPGFSNFTRKFKPKSLNNKYEKLVDENNQNNLVDNDIANATPDNIEVNNLLLGDNFTDINLNTDNSENTLKTPLNVVKKELQLKSNVVQILENLQESEITENLRELLNIFNQPNLSGDDINKLQEYFTNVVDVYKSNGGNNYILKDGIELDKANTLTKLYSIRDNIKKNKSINVRQTQNLSINNTKIQPTDDKLLKKYYELTQEMGNKISETNKLKDQIEESRKQIEESKQQITELTEKNETLTGELMKNEMKNYSNIVVYLDKTRFYTDICKNIKNIIINAYFLKMLFDKLFGDTSSENEKERKKEINTQINEMKDILQIAIDRLITFVKNMSTTLNIDQSFGQSLENIDSIAKTSLQANMTSYLFAATFFATLGGGVGRKSKTLRLNNKQNKSIGKKQNKKNMKGGEKQEESIKELITKVVSDICQQMVLNNNLLKYITDKEIDFNEFNEISQIFNTLKKTSFTMVNKTGKNLEPESEALTHFLVPYNNTKSDNTDVEKIMNNLTNQNQEKTKIADAILEPEKIVSSNEDLLGLNEIENEKTTDSLANENPFDKF